MILVADSGSSKTDWMGYTPDGSVRFETQGINPYFLNAQEIYKIFSKNKDVATFADEVKEIYFFGAGCSSPDKHEVISNGLSSYFKNAFISVEHDLIGSAYATCGNQAGLTCILGTGSNISYFDGVNVFDGKHGLGYVLGDEGSGTFFGKKIITSYFYGIMPEELRKVFALSYSLDKESLIENVYQEPYPNTYLAGFSRFMADNKEHPFIQKTLADGFQEFINTNIKDFEGYADMECHFVGSIAYYYQLELKQACEVNGIKVGKILQKPIEGIYQYILRKEGVLA